MLHVPCGYPTNVKDFVHAAWNEFGKGLLQAFEFPAQEGSLDILGPNVLAFTINLNK